MFNKKAAKQLFIKAIGNNGLPEKISIDKRGSNQAAIKEYNSEKNAEIKIQQIKYLNNLVEQDHRAIMRIVRPMLGFKKFHLLVA